MSQMPADARERRLLWRCRRGLKELDVLLERYVRAAVPCACDPQRRTLERLLELPDPELAGYLLGGRLAQDPELAALIEHILAFSAAGRAALEAESVAPHEPLGA